MKNTFKPLADSVLIPFGLTATTASAADARIYKKILGSGHPLDSPSQNTTQVISNDKMENIIKRVESLEDSGLLLKWVSETIQNDVKKQKEGFLSILQGTLQASLLGNILAGKVILCHFII